MAGEAESPVRSIERAARIIKTLGDDPASGARLSELAAATGLGKSTVHRIVAALIAQGFVYQNPETRLYHLGDDLVRLAHASSAIAVAEAARPSLDRLAEETEDVAFAQIREGDETICLDRRVGAFPIKTLTLDVGDRRPLGVGAGSLALLAWRPDDRIEDYLSRYAPRAEYAAFTADVLRILCRRSRREGYALNEGRIVRGMGAVGVAVADEEGSVVAALSVAAIEERMKGAWRGEVVALLQEEASAMAARFAARRPED